ncbi:Maf family protein [Prosthecomicrobium pneumaticum]|uniref:Nucleoside triphosphate pyrophosphatase n=1 Tax=Prosthecomicrobium pneumaticum TaxID=81895 RepID=A0A7W9FNY4_9HYPH|nr:Maf family protein [Prosthecomicrobium pneumaticum]MBB5754106.1 septum formation protein [Prosthecomicrobium pneumaticum]
MTTLILASTSSARIALLRGAGLSFEAVGADVDERALEEPLLAAGATPAEVADALAQAKALAVSRRRPDALVIGGDQVLDLAGERFVKPDGRAGAKAQLARLSGRTHHLRSAVALARGGAISWRHLASASLTLRPLDGEALDRYLDRAGDAVTRSVGAYQLEGIGIQLFERIEGDYFTILGLPLLPLLAALRGEGLVLP